MGRTTFDPAPELPTRLAAPFHTLERSGRPRGRPDGAMDPGGRILGTYIHGLFHNAGLRRAVLESLVRWKGVTLPPRSGSAFPGQGVR